MSPGGEAWKGHARIMAPAWSNWHLPPEYLDELRALHGVARERYWLGKWVGSDGMVYDKWDREKHVADSSWPAKRKVYGVDEGYKDPFTVVEVEVDTDGRLRVTREVYQSQLTQAEKIRMVKDMAGESEVIVDSSAPDLIESMRREGIDAKACQKGAGSVNFGIGLIQQRLVVLGDGLPRLTVDPSCTNTIREFETYEWKPGGDRLKDEPYDKDNHAMDALRYAVRHLDDGDACYGYAAPVRRQDRRGVWQ
jgi:phage terminase large subunit